MKHFVLIAALSVPSAVVAQDTPMQKFLEDLESFSETVRPMMEGWAKDLAPLLKDLASKIDDLSSYEMPEVLPNGDIIIRRKPTVPSPTTAPDGATEL